MINGAVVDCTSVTPSPDQLNILQWDTSQLYELDLKGCVGILTDGLPEKEQNRHFNRKIQYGQYMYM